MTEVPSSLVGKAGETLVAAELMRRGVEVAYPASDVGVDLLAYRLSSGHATATKFVPIQVKSRAGTGYNFQRIWFSRAPGIVLVHVWNIIATPEFYIFANITEVEIALGSHAETRSWRVQGGYNVTNPTARQIASMRDHRDNWGKITDQLVIRPEHQVSD